MASDITRDWHNQLMAQERARVLDRIAYGTKSSSPQIVNARRLNPLFYSNPLPDNSSGSKNRPIGATKDESGRPDANMIVAMAQGQAHFPHEGMPHGGMRGGVLRNYKYAKMILERRGRDSEDINLSSQGLPPVPGPLLELSDVESRKLELDTLITSLNDAIEVGDITQLTVGELKNIPRLMVALAPVFTENDIVSLIRQFEEMIESLEVSATRAAQRIIDYFQEKVLVFLKALLHIVNLQPQDKDLAVRQMVKEVFKYSERTKPSQQAMPAEQVPQGPPQGPPQPPPGPPQRGEEEEEAEEEAEEEEEQARPEPRPRPRVARNEDDAKAEEARRVINTYEGRANRIPAELADMYEKATRRGVEGKNFGKIRSALLNWVTRNKGNARFNEWYDDYIA